MKKAADKFNLKPKNGLKFLIDHKHIPAEVGEEQYTAIAKFFRNTPTLSPAVVGAFLGGDGVLNGHVRNAYLNLIDFSNKDITYVGA